MLTLTQFLTPQNIRQGVICSSKKRALELLGKLAADSLNQSLDESEQEICAIACFNNLFKREKLGCTALNNGVALPHAKLPSACTSFTQPIAFFLQFESGIDYEAADHRDVDLIYAVLFPEQNCEEYRHILADIAEKLSNKNLQKHLRAANSSEEIWQVLAYADKHLQHDE